MIPKTPVWEPGRMEPFREQARVESFSFFRDSFSGSGGLDGMFHSSLHGFFGKPFQKPRLAKWLER